jgi:hypothetical protein
MTLVVTDRDELEQVRNLCLECGREQRAGLRGWRAYLTTDEDGPAEALLYCPSCAEGEFGAETNDDDGA